MVPRPHYIGRGIKGIMTFIKECRIDNGGVPQFLTEFAGDSFNDLAGKKIDGVTLKKNIVLARCYASYGKMHGGLIDGIPDEDYNVIKSQTGEWRYFVEKYGKEYGISEQI